MLSITVSVSIKSISVYVIFRFLCSFKKVLSVLLSHIALIDISLSP